MDCGRSKARDQPVSAGVSAPVRGSGLKKAFAVALVLVFSIVSSPATTKTRRPARARQTSNAHKRQSSDLAKAAAEKAAADARAARAQVAVQIKNLTHFLYLLGGIEKGIELGDPAGTGLELSPAALELNNRNKAKVRASITTVRQGLEKLETDFRFTLAFRNYSQYLTGVANFAEVAESQAAANHFDEAGRSLLKALDQLTDALAAMR